MFYAKICALSSDIYCYDTGLFLNAYVVTSKRGETNKLSCWANNSKETWSSLDSMFPQLSKSLWMSSSLPIQTVVMLELCWKYNLLGRMWYSWQIPNRVYSAFFSLHFFAAEHLIARPDRPRPAPAVPLTDGQPWYQHSDPAGPAISSVQLRHHSGSIDQQTDRVSRPSGWRNQQNKKFAKKRLY